MAVRDLEKGRRSRSQTSNGWGTPSSSSWKWTSPTSRRCASSRRLPRGRRASDVLVNNAGVMPPERDAPRRASSSPSRPTSSARSCSRASCSGAAPPARRRGSSTSPPAGCTRQRLHPDDLQLTSEITTRPFYAHTKRCEVVLDRDLAEAAARRRGRLHSMHPGWADTPGVADSLPRLRPRDATAPSRRRPGAPTRSSGSRARRRPRTRSGLSGTTASRVRRTACPGPARRRPTASALFGRCEGLSGVDPGELPTRHAPRPGGVVPGDGPIRGTVHTGRTLEDDLRLPGGIRSTSRSGTRRPPKRGASTTGTWPRFALLRPRPLVGARPAADLRGGRVDRPRRLVVRAEN